MCECVCVCVNVCVRARLCIRALAGTQNESFLHSIYSVTRGLSGSTTLLYPTHAKISVQYVINIKSCFIPTILVKNISNFTKEFSRNINTNVHSPSTMAPVIIQSQTANYLH